MFISQKSSNFALVIEIDRHIEILLLSNDCVIVPELGGFMAHHIDAHYDEDDQIFLPPLRTLGFNQQLTINDSLLAQSYVEAYDISYPEALRRIEDEVNQLKRLIENEGSYELNDIGVLSLCENGKYLFTPCEAGILTPELYGLSSFEMKPLKRKPAEMPVEAPAEQPAVLMNEPEAIAEVQPVEMETHEPVEIEPQAPEATEILQPIEMEAEVPVGRDIDEPVEAEIIDERDADEENAVVIKMSWLRNAVAIAAVLLAFFLIALPVNNDNVHRTISYFNNALLTGMTAKDSNMEKIVIQKPIAQPIIEKVDTAIEAKADTTTFSQPADTIAVSQEEELQTEPQTTQLQTNEGDYYIVLASYVTKKNAEAFVEDLHKRGHKEAEVYVRNNVTRVVCGNFKTETDAYNRLNDVRSEKDFKEAWVLTVKNES